MLAFAAGLTVPLSILVLLAVGADHSDPTAGPVMVTHRRRDDGAGIFEGA